MRPFVSESPTVRSAAHTDAQGYAAATIPAPAEPGVYTLLVQHGDKEGKEMSAAAPVYVWDPADAVIAVDLDSLPSSGSEVKSARAAVKRLAQDANILYLTRQSISAHEGLHGYIKSAGLPDGPILLWQRENWHMVYEGKYNVPRMVVETRMVSPLPTLRRMFPKFAAGVCDSVVPARAFADAGLKSVIVGAARPKAPTSSTD